MRSDARGSRSRSHLLARRMMNVALEHDEADRRVAEREQQIAERQLAADDAEREMQRQAGADRQAEQRLARRAIGRRGDMRGDADRLQAAAVAQRIDARACARRAQTCHRREQLNWTDRAEEAVVHERAAQQAFDDGEREQLEAHVRVVGLVGADVRVGDVRKRAEREHEDRRRVEDTEDERGERHRRDAVDERIRAAEDADPRERLHGALRVEALDGTLKAALAPLVLRLAPRATHHLGDHLLQLIRLLLGERLQLLRVLLEARNLRLRVDTQLARALADLVDVLLEFRAIFVRQLDHRLD